MNDSYAREVIRAGTDLGVTPRGIVIGLATVFVESNWVMYANPADPESLNFPHEALSYDANSVGLFQQRAEWWGTAADRMDPYRSARMFFTQLQKTDYNNPKRSPGFYAQQVQGSAFPDRYDQHIDEAQRLYNRLASKEKPVEKVLDYPRGRVGDYDGVAQTKPWDCGPASVQVILSACGITRTEDWIIDQANAYLSVGDRIGVDGTNHAGLLCPLLNRLLPGSGYTEVWVPQANPQTTEAFWTNLKKSIDGGRGVLLNFEIPPWQGIKASRDSKAPPYPTGSTTYHYTAGMGYAVDGDGSRHVWVADPASFGGVTGFWSRLEDVVLYIVPHAYAWASTAAAAAQPTPAPAPTPGPTPIPKPEPAVDLSDRLTRLWTEFDALFYGDQAAIAVIVRAAKAGDVRAQRTLAKLEQANPAALKAFIAA